MLKLVVGLGNPGDRFVRTRHNIGFRLVERLGAAAESPPRWQDFKSLGSFARAGRLLLARPETYMNESGRFLRAFADYYHVEPGQMLVCYDDVALPFGKIRIRKTGSSGGQNGMRSIIEHLRTEDIPRMRLGVGPQPERMDSADFVLQRFSKPEEEGLPAVLDAAAQAVALALDEGLDAAMNRFNPAA